MIELVGQLSYYVERPVQSYLIWNHQYARYDHQLASYADQSDDPKRALYWKEFVHHPTDLYVVVHQVDEVLIIFQLVICQLLDLFAIHLVRQFGNPCIIL